MLLERHVEGRELAVSLLEGDAGVEALPIVEAKPRQEYFFDFEARYEIGKTDFVCPADLPAEVTARAQEVAVGRVPAARLLRLRARRHDPVDRRRARRSWRHRRSPG